MGATFEAVPLVPCDACEGKGADSKGDLCFMCEGNGFVCPTCQVYPCYCWKDAEEAEEAEEEAALN